MGQPSALDRGISSVQLSNDVVNPIHDIVAVCLREMRQ